MMATKSDIAEDTSRSFATLYLDFERTLPWLIGGRHYLQGSRQDFIESFLPGDDDDRRNTVKSDPAELIEVVERALAKGDLGIAESYSIKAIRTAMFNNSCKKSPQPYRYLAEVLQRKAEEKNLQLPQRQLFLLQAAALYNFVLNYLKTEDVGDELSKTLSKVVSRKLFDIQDNMVEIVGGNPLHCKFDSELKKNELKNLRDEIKQSFESMGCRMLSNTTQSSNKCNMREMMNDVTEKIKNLCDTISVKMKEFLAAIINECLELLGTPPCYYEVIVLGSLARNEMTPYSDFEWAILTDSEEEECKVFFRNLTNLAHLQIINLGETILPSMNIEAINEEWFYDDKTAKGISFDGLLPQACKTPLGNMPLGNTPEFELIHIPKKMADFQSNDWYRKNWKLGDTLFTVSPLQPDKHMLVDAYRKEMAKILSCPCDSECCKHDASYGACLTRGSCRGMRTLCEDVSRYGDMLTGNNALDDGKLYDVKKEIYRITDRIFAALAKCYEVDANGTFAILDELYRREIISSEARDNFASASAIAIKLRIGTYLKAGKQGEQLMTSSNEEGGKLTSVYFMPNNEELFHFFFIAIPLYEELQKLKAAGNIPPSLTHTSFYDDSDVTMGDIHCRLLNYDEALKCYDRTVELDSENLSTEIRRISIALCITKGTEEMDKVRENLDTLLCKIEQSWSEPHRETILAFVDRLNSEEMRQLLAVLYLSSSCFGCLKYSNLAGNILVEDASATKYSLGRKVHYVLMVLEFLRFKSPKPDIINDVMSIMPSLIDKEGVSTKSIHWLNILGEFLFYMRKLDKAYHCFQRALRMERILYQTKPNMNMMTSLYYLGMASHLLLMYRESKFYFELFVQLFELFGRPDSRLIDVKIVYWKLAMASQELGDSAEECVCYLEKGLITTAGNQNDGELLDCFLYSQLATVWHAEANQEQASKSVLNAKACLRKIVGVNERIITACRFAEKLAEIQKINEGIEILKEEVQIFSCPTIEKVLCLMRLGELCLMQGLGSDAENYYKEALKIFREMQDNGDTSVILECRIGMSKAIVMDNRVYKAKKALDQAFDLATKLHANYNVFLNIGQFCEDHGYITSAWQWFDEGLRSYKELSIVSKDSLFMEIGLAMKVGQLGKDASAIDSVSFETAIQVQRLYYDRAAKLLRQHVATQEVDSTTVKMFLFVALQYESVDKKEMTKLLLEALNVCERVYGKNISNEMVINIFEKLSCTYFETGEFKDCIKYSELLIKMEMDPPLPNPLNIFFERVFVNLAMLAILSLGYSVSIDTAERAYEVLLSAQKDSASTDSAAKTVAAECFACLGIILYTLSDLEKAKTSIDMASQIFNEIEESVERKNLSFKKTCEIMKEILSSKKILPSDKTKIYASISEVVAFKEDILAKDSKSLDNCSDGRENVELFIGSSDDVKRQEIDSLNLTVDRLPKVMHQINLPVEVDSFPDASLNPESSNLKVKQLALRAHLDALEHNRKKGNVHQAARIHSFVEVRQLSLNENCSYDDVEKLISDAIRTKEDNDFSSCIRSLDLVLQLASNWKQKTKILKFRAEIYLSSGDFRTAAINFNKAACVFSNETVRNRDDMCEYLEVAIGLIKAEMLCQNVAVAWYRYCVVAIQLVSHHEHEEFVPPQAIELHYLGAKCLYILLESKEGKDVELVNICLVCQQALLHEENRERKIWLVEVNLLYVTVLRKLHAEERADKILEGLEKPFINLAEQSNLAFQKENPKYFCHLLSCIGRVLVERGEIKQSTTWLTQSLWAYFSAALPGDMLSFYEELLPLLQAITVTKSSGTSRKSLSSFQQAFDMCKDVLVKKGSNLNDVYEFLKTLVNLYMALGRTEEAIVVAETALEISGFMGDNTNRINNRARMLLYLAQMHQLNSTNSAFDQETELNLAEWYYQTDHDLTAEFVLQKNLSYANFLCEQKRFAEADAVLQNMNKLGEELSNKCLYCAYFSRIFYGPGIQKSVEDHGELLSTVEHCMYSTMVRVFVGIGKKREAVAACEKLTDNPVVVHDAIYGKRPSSIPYLIEACHRELLLLLSDGDQMRFQNCEFPLSPANIFELYYKLNEYSLALKYYPKETQSPELIEMKFSCLRLTGNELVELGRKNESYLYFAQFLLMLQSKKRFFHKPFHAQCATLADYSFANQYYIFRSLGSIMAFRGNLDSTIQCFERCLELDEDLALEEDLFATLADLYQSQALTVDIENPDFCKRQMNLALDLFQKLLQKTAELTQFVEYRLGSLLLKLERYGEAVEHFENVINKPGYEQMCFDGVDKPLVDVYLCREIEASGRVAILVKVGAFYELILMYMKLNEVEKAKEVALRLENYAGCLKRVPEACLELSIVGYANKIIGNKEKAAEIFLDVLEIKPGHLPVAEALESLCL